MSMYPIATGNITAAFSLNNIPQTFDHLQLRILSRSTQSGSAANLAISPSSSPVGSGGTASINDIAINGGLANNSALTLATSTGATYSLMPVSATFNSATLFFTTTIIDIYDYKNTNKNKLLKINNIYDLNGSGHVSMRTATWASTSAIQSIYFDISTGWTSGSRFDPYGISNSTMTGA